MSTKQSTSKKQTVAKASEAAPAARAAKPKAPRIKQSTHSKSVAAAEEVITVVTIQPENSIENPQEAIAKIAYGYWEARGYQPGDPVADWLRAESEYQQRSK